MRLSIMVNSMGKLAFITMVITGVTWRFSCADEETVYTTSDGLLQHLLLGYKNHLPPTGKNISGPIADPVIIGVNFFVRRLSNIDEDEMKYHLEITFRQEWTDYRLSYAQSGNNDLPYLTLKGGGQVAKIWTPDTVFINAIETKDYNLMEANEMMRIFPDGKITFSKRVGLTLAQPMIFDDFPFDQHSLYLDISSYGNAKKSIVYEWRQDNPIQFKSNAVHDHIFNVTTVRTGQCSGESVNGRYSCLRAEFHLKRKPPLTHLFEFFAPSFVLVILSWLPFMICIQSIPARSIITLACLITIILQIALIGDNIPATSNFTWVHVWLITCFSFIAAVQFQLVARVAIIHFCTRRLANEKHKEHRRHLVEQCETGSATGLTEHSAPLLRSKSSHDKSSILALGCLVDCACLMAFALAFFIFNCYFWATALL